MATKSIRVLVEMLFASKTIRLWDGAGPYMDANGDVWAGVTLADGLDTVESALNGEAATLTLAVSGVDGRMAELAYEDLDAGEVIGKTVRLMIQPCDEWDQPSGDPEVRFTGTIDNMPSDDSVQADQVVSSIAIEVSNRFNLRTLVSGSVLSDVDQRARAAILNPAADPDRFAERIPGLSDKSIVWPRYS